MKMKRILAVALSACMALTMLASCGNNGKQPNSGNNSNTSVNNSTQQPDSASTPKTIDWPKQGINIIGSAADADVRLEGVEGVSRRHAEVLVASDACQITDLHSTNGVQVNGARLKPGVPRVISEDDAIRIARMQLMITG